MIGPGQLSRRLTLEAAVESDDGTGGVVRLYEAVGKVWAQVNPVAMQGDVRADAFGGALRYRIILRAGPMISTRHRFRDSSGQIYRVNAVRPSADRRFTEIEVEVRED